MGSERAVCGPWRLGAGSADQMGLMVGKIGRLSYRSSSQFFANSFARFLEMASKSLEEYQTQLIEQSMVVDALKFGAFTLKSGR